MGLRKAFGFLSKEQKTVLRKEATAIMDRCEAAAVIERRELRESQELHDRKCPNCKTMGINVVDRFANVEGLGNVSGSMVTGIRGGFAVKTTAVNHCKNCTHEWEKFKTKTISRTVILKAALKRRDPEILGDCYAETLHFLLDINKNHLHTSYMTKLSVLRKTYKSVYDKKK